MAKLSTHILDTANGVPAQGVRIDFERLNGTGTELIKTVTTNSDGRTDDLLLDSHTMEAGEYQLTFYIADYFSSLQNIAEEAAFLNKVPVRFSILDASDNYHVPLLVTPWSYSTYRGS
jgi:5-hydroxyisourate hydrolase